MKWVVCLVFAFSFLLGTQVLADHHESKKSEMMEMGADFHMKMATQHEKLAVAHKDLSECLKANAGKPKQCKEKRMALKELKKAKKEMKKEWKGKRKGKKKGKGHNHDH